MFASFHSLGILPSRRDLLNNTVEDGVFIRAISLRNLARTSSGPGLFQVLTPQELIELLEQAEKCPK